MHNLVSNNKHSHGVEGSETEDTSLLQCQRRLDTLTDLHGTVWLVNIATWRRLSKCVFVLALPRALDLVGAPYSVCG